MASKKEWKRRAKTQERLANQLFAQSVKRAEELARVDIMLKEVEFPGPDIESYVAQTQQFLQRLADERGLGKKCCSDDPTKPQTGTGISGQNTKPSTSSSSPDGEYQFLTDDDISPYAQVAKVEGRRATRS